MKLTLSKSLISVATATLLVTGFTGCNDDSSSNTVGKTYTKTQAKGTVVGLVQDTNGEAIPGVKVTLGDMTTTTNDGGQYQFNNVPVVNAAGANEDTAHQSLSVTIKAPEGYIGATVTVYPEAQYKDGMPYGKVAGNESGSSYTSESSSSYSDSHGFDGYSVNETHTNSYSYWYGYSTTDTYSYQDGYAIDSSSNSSSYGSSNADYTGRSSDELTVGSTNNVVVFVDGFMASAGTAVLPALTSSATGRLQVDNNTGVSTGANVNVRLDFTSGGTVGVNQEQMQNGVTTTYAVPTYSVVTDANGVFMFPAIPDDSNFRLYVPGYTGGTTFSTDNEGLQALSNILVTPITMNDTIAPRVASVANTFGLVQNRLMLDKDTNQIVINFSEPVEADDIASFIKVYAGTTASNEVEVTDAQISGSQLTVTLGETLGNGEMVELYILRETRLRDLAGNELVFNRAKADDEDGTYADAIDLSKDCNDGCEDDSLDYLSCTIGARAIQFDLMGYKELNTMAEAATDGVQMELDTDVVRSASSSLSALEEYSNAYNNVSSNDINISQLNNVSENRTDTPDNVGTRLENLAAALGKTVTVDTDTARIQFVAHNATAYQITVPDPAATCTAGNLAVTVTKGSCANVDQDNGVWTVTGFAPGDTVEVTVSGVEHGDDVVITPVDDLCYPGTPAEVALVDNVAPTTILQNSYCVGGSVHGGLSAVVAFGDGGELTNAYGSTGDLGTPALFVTPGLLDNLSADGTNILNENDANAWGDNTLSQELFVHDHADSNFTASAGVYDATAYAVFAENLDRTVGVAFSEDVALDGVQPTYSGTTVPSDSYVVKNNVVKNDSDGNITQTDLVRFETTNVLSLANDNDGEIMSFEGILDLADNAADTSAKVVTIDAMPPMITKAIFNGESAVITFNEQIALVDGEYFTLEGSVDKNMTYDETESPATWTLSDDNKTLTITSTDLNSSDFTTAHEYDESDLYDLDEDVYKHAVLHFDTIEDIHGNAWADWNNTKCTGEVETPAFAMISAIGDFKVIEVDNSGFAAPNEHQAISWTFNQAIRTGEAGDFFASCGDTETNASVIDAWFSYENGGSNPLASHVDDVSFHLTADCKTIELTFDFNTTTMGDQVTTNSGHVFTSAVDETQNEVISASANAE